MKIRKCLIIFVVLLFLFAHHPIKIAFAEEDLNTENSVDEIIAEIAEGLDLSALEEFLKNNLGDYDLNELITSAKSGNAIHNKIILPPKTTLSDRFLIPKSSIIPAENSTAYATPIILKRCLTIDLSIFKRSINPAKY